MYSLRRLRSFGASSQILSLFYTSVVQTVMLYCSTAWFNSLSVVYKNKLFSQIKICAKMIGWPVEGFLRSYEDAQTNSMLRLAKSIYSDPSHVLNQGFSTFSAGDPQKCFGHVSGPPPPSTPPIQTDHYNDLNYRENIE